tara:strand:+ start:1314 stop:3077 length:1764 start_codon:yes stop_codon:yes gene_type:complete
VKANEVKIIDLHKNKSLDQLVLETKDLSNSVIVSSDSELPESQIEKNADNNLNNETSENNISVTSENEILKSDQVTEVKSQELFDISYEKLNLYLENTSLIKSNILKKELVKIIANPDVLDQKEIETKIYLIVKKLYESGEIGKAYKLIKEIKNKNSNKEHQDYFTLIELNYLLSTFQLSEVCDLKSSLIEKNILLPLFLLEKTDVFCLTLENKLSEAKLLNSLIVESENQIDDNFQKLFNFMVSEEKEINKFEFKSSVEFKELIFLYSAMLRINELPLDEKFIEIDPLNLSIPVILSSSTDMRIRIKAANKAFYDNVLSIDSLSALYQSVDFSSKELANPIDTLLSLQNNAELTMAFYYQLANIQIFPDERLSVILDYWDFSKKAGLQKIAYSITQNIIKTFSPTSENIINAEEIILAHISNKNFDEASKWIQIFEGLDNADKLNDAKFLIDLNENNEMDTILSYLSSYDFKNNTKLDQASLESIEIILNFLNIYELINIDHSYNKIIDERLMPTYSVVKDLKKQIELQKDTSVFFLALISMNNKTWRDLHPEHLKLILEAFTVYAEGTLIKNIVLEILKDFEIIE